MALPSAYLPFGPQRGSVASFIIYRKRVANSFLAQDQLRESAFNHALLLPDGSGHPLKTAGILHKIHDADKARKAAKEAIGQNGTSLTNIWRRLLSYELFSPSTDGAFDQTLSAIANTGTNISWGRHSVPFPLITSIGVNYPETCLPDAIAP